MRGRAVAFLLAALLLPTLGAAASPAAWTRPRGDDANTGAEGTPPGGSGQLAWNVTLAAPVTGPPVAALARVVVGAEDGQVYGLDAATGRILWSYRAPGAQRSPAMVHDGIAYLGAGQGIYALDVRDGTLTWSREAGDAVRAQPLFTRGVLVVGTVDGKLLGLDPTTADPVWEAVALDGPAHAGAVAAGGTAWVATQAGTLYGVNSTTGEVLHAIRVGPSRSVPALAEGLLWLTTGTGVHAIDPATGLHVHNWTMVTGETPLTSAVVARQRLWTGTDRGVTALDLCTGRPLWRASMPAVASDLTLAGRFLYVTAADGTTRALEADTGREAWRFSASAPVQPGSPQPMVLSDGRLYAGMADGNVRAFDATAGTSLAPGPAGAQPCQDPQCHLPSQEACCGFVTGTAREVVDPSLPANVRATLVLDAPFGCSARAERDLDPAGRIELRTLASPGRAAVLRLPGVAEVTLGPATNLTVLEMQVEVRSRPDLLDAPLPGAEADGFRILRVADLAPGHQHSMGGAGRAGPVRVAFSTFNAGASVPDPQLRILAWDGDSWADVHAAASGGSRGISGATRDMDLVVLSAGRATDGIHATLSRPGVYALAEPLPDDDGGGGSGFGPAVWISAAAVAILLAAAGAALVLFLSRKP